jgi:uncharacterized protein (TIGR02145 family)
MPKAFKLDTLGNNALRLSWIQIEKHIDGFAIQKTTNGQIKEILLPLDSLSYTDTEVTQGSGIVSYKISARAGNNRSDEIGTMQGIEVPISISIDVDGNQYNIIIIGSQKWFVENLKTTRYCNGDSISSVTDNLQWAGMTTGAFGNYNNISSNDVQYGKLYNGYAVNDSRNICPCGWHVPSDLDWDVLINYLGGSLIAGGKLKSTGTIDDGNGLWQAPNVNATNESLFSALPGGYRSDGGFYDNIGYYGYYWSANQGNTSNKLWTRSLRNFSGSVQRGEINKVYGLSVRCIKD